MNRRTLLILATSGVLVLLFAIGWLLGWGRPPEPIVLNDADVESVTAEVFPVDGMGVNHIPPFTIPPEYRSHVLDALRPIVASDYPAGWDEFGTIAKLSIRKRDGSNIDVLIPMCGQNSLCFKLNGIQCGRDGPYEPVDDIVHDGIRLGYGDESLMLYEFLRQIHNQTTTGEEDPRLADAFANLQRSAGKLPPRPH